MKSSMMTGVLLLFLFSPEALARQGIRDTTVTESGVMLGEVVITTGARNETDVRHLSQTVTVIGRKEIEQSMQASLLPVLTEQVPGLFTTSRGMMGYGVSDGAAGGISLRGLSGGNARMMVLIDGHPQYAGIFGHPVSDAYQTMLAEQVEVLRGPASVLYGSNAMGGVVNIVTRKMNEEGVRTHLRAGAGSYGTVETELTGRMRRERFSSVVGASYNRTDGHRERMPFEQYGGYAKLGYEMTHRWKVRADVSVTHFNASYPGPVAAPLLEGDQRITRGMTSFALENRYANTAGALSLFYNWGNHWINDGYTPGKGESPQEGRFNSLDNMMGVSLYQSARLFNGNRMTIGADFFRYGGEAWTEYVKGDKAGTRRSIVDRHDNEAAGYMDLRQDFGQLITFNIGLRADHHSRVGTEWIPQAGLAFHLPRYMEMKLSAAKGFRYPVLREMYMFPPQNPDLKPESMWNYEMALSQSLCDGRFVYGINIFYIDGKNLIMTLPNPNGSGRLNQNSGKVDNSGIEVQTAWRVNRLCSVDANYSFLHMERPLIAAPEHKLYAGVDFTTGRWKLATGLQYINGLYTTVSPDIKENFALWNVRSAFRAAGWLELWIRGENLLAQRYEINAGYPMPRATVMAGVRVGF